MNYLDCGSRVHRVGFAFHAHYGGDPLPQRPCSLRGWVVLTCAASESSVLQRNADSGIAASAGPRQVSLIRMFFVAVHMVHFDVLRCSAERADVWPRGAALWGIRPITCGAVGYGLVWLSPSSAASAARYSFPRSSSSSSSSSEGATTSMISFSASTSSSCSSSRPSSGAAARSATLSNLF